MECLTNSILESGLGLPPLTLSLLRQEFGHTQKVIGSTDPPRGSGSLTDFKIDQKLVSVLHQGMRPATQPSRLSGPLAHQTTSGSAVDSWVSLLRSSP